MSADALSRIRARGPIGIRLGLDRVLALLGRLGDPQLALRGVLIGGTNGKGSVAAMVAAMIAAAGKSTMQSPSPHLHSYRERILIDGQPIGEKDLDELLEEVLRASEPGEAKHGPATEYELLTAAAYLRAAREHIDVVVMEVGLGGRMDASNSWDANVAAITNVGLDHQEFLGHTIESIAIEKAAIIKPRSRAVTGARGVGLRVIRSRAELVGAPLTIAIPIPVESMDVTGLVLNDKALGRLDLPMLGRHQAANAGVALGIISLLREADIIDLSDAAVRRGLAAARWPGRLELLTLHGCRVLLDGAHNPDGTAALAATIDELVPSLPGGRATLLAGVMADKEVTLMLESLARSEVLRRARFIASGVPDSDRALSAGELALAWSEVTGSAEASAYNDADVALAHGLEQARSDGGLLVVAGSLYLVGYIRAQLLPDEVVG